MMKSNEILVAYDYDSWVDYQCSKPICVDISTNKNSHMLISGMSGSAKSSAEIQILARIVKAYPNTECFFADYKQEDDFQFLCGCKRYYPYKRTLEALDIVYERLQNRQSREDKSRHPVLLVWDEYVANMLALINTDKKLANTAINKVSEILMIGRSLSVRILISCQRPDSIVFAAGAKLNFGIIMVLGASIQSIYEMLIPDEYIKRIGERVFHAGEGVLLLQGSELHLVKVPIIRNEEKMRELCIKALS